MAFRQFFFGLCSALCGILISLNAPAQTANYSSSPQLGVTGTITAAIQTASGNYLSAVDGGTTGGSGNTSEGVAIQPADGTAGEFGTFTVVWLDPSYKKFALRTSSGNYVTAINGGGVGGPNDNSSPIHTDATSISGWETFRLNFLPNNQVTISTATGSYLNAVNGGGVDGSSMSSIRTSATQIRPAETFTLVTLGASTLQQDASKAGQSDTALAGAVLSLSQQTIVSPDPGTVPIAQSTSTQSQINPLTGPSFPCPKPQDPLAQLFCTSPQLALLDMQFVKTYDALHQQIGPAGDEALRQEDVALELTIRSRCGIAMPQGNSPSPPPPAPPGADQCVIAAYKQQIGIWKSRLSGAASEEANRSIPGQIALQARLQALGYLPPQAQLDSVFGSGTRAAIIQWQTSTGRQPTGLLGDADATALLATSGAPGQVTTTPPAIPTPANPASNVEQAWVPFIPYAACMSKNGFLLQTFVQEGVPPSEPIATAAIEQCKPTGSQQSEGSVLTSPTPSVPTPNNQPQTSPPAPSGPVQQTLQSPPATANGPTPPENSDGLVFSNSDGIAYANLKETSWTEKKTSNPMTDTVDVTAVSNQNNGSGASAQVTASCSNGEVSLEALVTDNSGNSTVNLANEQDESIEGLGTSQSVGGTLRLNANPAANASFQITTYSNQFIITQLSNDSVAEDASAEDSNAGILSLEAFNDVKASSVWRIFAEVDTDHGSLLIKIPIYDPAIEDVITSCLK